MKAYSPRAVLVRLNERSDLQQLLPSTVSWIQEAGSPYFDWLVGNEEIEQQFILRSVQDPRSEFSAENVHLLFGDNRPLGGIVMMPAAELLRRRAADLLALLREAGPERADALKERVGQARGLFPPLERDAFYFSRIGVVPEKRGTAVAGAVFSAGMQVARERGYRTIRCEVFAGNVLARRLFEYYDFQVVHEGVSTAAGMRYLSLRWDA